VNHCANKVRKVIVIAASAGGIDAIKQVLRRIPADLPAAIICVQHLQGNHRTYLPEYLARNTSLRAYLAEKGMPLETGTIYVAVPGQHLCIENGCLVLNMAEPVHNVRPAADVLFASAAQSFGPDVIGVVLTGTGCDGAGGCQLIKAKGGITIAQDEQTSAYFSMPKAAIAVGAIDYVLPLEGIAARIVELVEQE